jgi:hypothetical protein
MTGPRPDLVDRDFNAAGPNQLWVADITHVPTWRGFSISPSCSTPGAARSSAWSGIEIFWRPEKELLPQPPALGLKELQLTRNHGCALQGRRQVDAP